MNTYNPRISHSVYLIVFGCLLMGMAGNMFEGTALAVSLIGGTMMMILAVLVAWFLANRERIAFYDAVTRLAEQLSRLDQDQWRALGIAFPTLRIHWDGTPTQLLEDSDITLDEFARFMKDSNPHQISPERNWSNGRERRTWLRIKTWLESCGYIKQQSAAGNHSWLWIGNSFYTLRERYLAAKPLPNLGGTPAPETAPATNQ
jgi:hypothetical protein